MSEQKYDLAIGVVEDKGRCPVYEVGACFHSQERYQLVTDGRCVCTRCVRYVRITSP